VNLFNRSCRHFASDLRFLPCLGYGCPLDNNRVFPSFNPIPGLSPGRSPSAYPPATLYLPTLLLCTHLRTPPSLFAKPCYRYPILERGCVLFSPVIFRSRVRRYPLVFEWSTHASRVFRGLGRASCAFTTVPSRARSTPMSDCDLIGPVEILQTCVPILGRVIAFRCRAPPRPVASSCFPIRSVHDDLDPPRSRKQFVFSPTFIPCQPPFCSLL